MESTSMGEESPGHVLSVENVKASRLGDHGARVTDLTARLGVKGRRVEKELALAVLAGEYAHPGRFEGVARDVATEQPRRPVLLDQVAILRVVGPAQRLRARASAFALGGHGFVEGLARDTEARLRHALTRQ